jgi:hypothetical protein
MVDPRTEKMGKRWALLPGWLVAAGAVPEPRAGETFEGGVGLVRNRNVFDPPAPDAAVHTLTGPLWNSGHQCAVEVDGAAVALMSDERFDADLAGNRVMVTGVLTVETQWWQPGPLRNLLPHGWQTWRVLEVQDAGRGTSRDRLVLLEPA